MFCKTWNSEIEILDDSQTSKYLETETLKLDSSKATQFLNWKPKWDLEKSVSMTIDWYKALEADEEMSTVCLKQVSDFQISKN